MINVVASKAVVDMVKLAMNFATGSVRENLTPVFAKQQAPAPAKAPVRNNTISPKAE